MSTRGAIAIFIVTTVVLAIVGFMSYVEVSLAALVLGSIVMFFALACAYIDRDSRIGLAAIFLVAVSVRWLVAAIVDQIIQGQLNFTFAPDEGFYYNQGVQYALHLKGMVPEPASGLYAKMVGWCFHLFLMGGKLVPKMVTGIMGGGRRSWPP